jgi:hypothetical protein
MLTLKQAISDGRLDDFIKQEEERGVGPIDLDELDTVIERAVRDSRLGDRKIAFCLAQLCARQKKLAQILSHVLL